MTLVISYAPLIGYLSSALIVTGVALWFSRHPVAQFAGTGLEIAGWMGWLRLELSARSGWAWVDGAVLAWTLWQLYVLRRLK